jgi:hypothetical protein
MYQDKNILVISDSENSQTIKTLSRLKLVPLIRRSILSAMELLRHHNISAVVIDKDNQNVDAIEFILNARDIIHDIPIFIPNQFYEIRPDGITKLYKKIVVYENEDQIKENINTYILTN